MEIWKDVKDYEGRYKISNLGKIKSFYGKEKLLKPKKNHGGYLEVLLYKNNKNRLHRVHRLVAEAFIPNPENKPEVNHKDGNKLNNRCK